MSLDNQQISSWNRSQLHFLRFKMLQSAFLVDHLTLPELRFRCRLWHKSINRLLTYFKQELSKFELAPSLQLIQFQVIFFLFLKNHLLNLKTKIYDELTCEDPKYLQQPKPFQQNKCKCHQQKQKKDTYMLQKQETNNVLEHSRKWTFINRIWPEHKIIITSYRKVRLKK